MGGTESENAERFGNLKEARKRPFQIEDNVLFLGIFQGLVSQNTGEGLDAHSLIHARPVLRSPVWDVEAKFETLLRNNILPTCLIGYFLGAISSPEAFLLCIKSLNSH